ncbi:hypothetical protein [Paenibacillus flagellatus]|uniref:DUF2178 domain-containing protein n=1 Tax=Paenibacillus flagellatus TaxID=2211139 RepID=A0A2V5KJ00_9BACL|nr:hypothetical protein [Paenibacillus flagellatus]PYI54550.1 hypothetical protein DLM86_13895 [Paenibacillus flagellatus]
MSYQEKKQIVSLFSAFLVFGAYCWIVYIRYNDMLPEGTELIRFWGAAMLILVPVTMVARLIIEILFIVINWLSTKEAAPSFTDELDKIIDLKAIRISYFVFILGFFMAMGSLVVQTSLTSMFVILFLAGFTADVAGILWRLHLYRKGV